MTSANQERALLHEIGTKAFRLRPGSIVSAAQADLRLRARKSEQEAEPSAPYAFHRNHVRKALTARDLISLALADRDRGVGSSKLNTRRIYEDEELLRDALGAAPPLN